MYLMCIKLCRLWMMVAIIATIGAMLSIEFLC